MELVSLQSPDGRPYKTDSQAEINLLVSTYGYTRVSEKNTTRSRTSTSKPTPKPAAAEAQPPQPRTSDENGS